VTCQRMELGESHTAATGKGDLPLCIQLPASKSPGIVMKMSVEPPDAVVCVRVEMLTAPRDLQQQERCLTPEDQGSITLSLLSPDTPHTYIFMPSVGEGERPVLTTEVLALEGNDDKESHPREVSAPAESSAASPPQCAPPSVDNRCASKEERAMAVCGNDTEALHRFLPDECPLNGCATDEISCLLAYKAELQWEECAEAIDDVADCLRGVGELLFPMVIAAYLLLATASVVLLCTMLRCCCRCVCAAPRSSHQDEQVSEDEGTDADDEYIVTPLPSGVKQAAKEEEEDENELPGYSEVVEGAAVLPRATEPLQTSAS